MCKATSTWADKENACRDFESVNQMNDHIINNINKYVKESDILFILGDLLFGNKIYITNLRNRIICKTIYLAYGNHDQYIRTNEEYKSLFDNCQDVYHIEVNKVNLFLSHYAHRVWIGSHKGFIHCFGHSHGSLPDFGKSMDVGIDAIYKRLGEYRPISFEEIIKIMKNKNVEYIDSHKNSENEK